LVVDGWSNDEGTGGGFKKTGANPTDRGKQGVKRSLLTEAAGIPIGIAIDGANRHDMKMVRHTLQSILANRPEPTKAMPQWLCLDKGYDFDEVREIVKEFGFTAHIRARGEEAQAIKNEAGFKARRWVVERTHSWMNRFRRILVRWEKLAETYLAMLHLVLGIITWRATGLLK
jgi:transposase